MRDAVAQPSRAAAVGGPVNTQPNGGLNSVDEVLKLTDAFDHTYARFGWASAHCRIDLVDNSLDRRQNRVRSRVHVQGIKVPRNSFRMEPARRFDYQSIGLLQPRTFGA